MKGLALVPMTTLPKTISFLVFLILAAGLSAQIRKHTHLNEGWYSIVVDSAVGFEEFQKLKSLQDHWVSVSVPHNWDQYEGYRRLQHGNRHGYAWYRRVFSAQGLNKSRRQFLFFEGVGSYARVYVNGKQVGSHAGGRTSFTVDISDAIDFNQENELVVKVDHPDHVQDLPWVCGGCSDEYGFSEGSQPFGIFRPVHLIETNEVRVEPFGVHAWNGQVSEDSAGIHINTEIKNYGSTEVNIRVKTILVDEEGLEQSQSDTSLNLDAGELITVRQTIRDLKEVQLWSTQNPYLYEIVTQLYADHTLLDEETTKYGIRWIKWDIGEGGTNRFYLNGEPVFINGTAEYEHNMGMSHAFSDEMVAARVSQMRSAGFNAFRDAHQPHNFRYHHGWDSLGVLWWTQMAAHIWFDTPEFRKNFKKLLKEWVRERRNSPSVVLWGLENESTLPTEFAAECTQIIRDMDPTSPSQRLVTTCNGGTGTDWNVPQNWTGTYGGNPDTYDQDLERQVLVGEYGAWRTLDLHTAGSFEQKGAYSENRMTLLMEKKVRLGEAAKKRSAGHFHWLFTSHENPGRNQSGEGLRELDRVGPVNYKGLLTPWGEPMDAYYMFRSNYAPKDNEPMVYIVSHTWPNRWMQPGIKDGLEVYSNCDSVALFNGSRLLGMKANPGMGRHFQWDSVLIEEQLIRAIGYTSGQQVAVDEVVFQNLPVSEELIQRNESESVITSGSDLNYWYRVNCGGPDYVDSQGQVWMADVAQTEQNTWGSISWTDDYEDMPPYFASQRRTFDPIQNTQEDTLYQTFRFGQTKLKYLFPVPDGKYQVQLHFIEPWYGTGGGLDCKGWRLFDVAVNEQVILDDLDVWSEAGHDRALVKNMEVEVAGGQLIIEFPQIKSGQAIISAIAVASKQKSNPVKSSPHTMDIKKGGKRKTWLDWGDFAFINQRSSFHYLPPELFGADWIQTDGDANLSLQLNMEADVYVAVMDEVEMDSQLSQFDRTKSVIRLAASENAEYQVYKKRFASGTKLDFEIQDERMIVFGQRATQLEPPYDLKPKVPYNEDVAVLKSSNLVKEKRHGFGCITVTSNEPTLVEWPILTGVADYHAIHFKYANETGKELSCEYRLVAVDGSLMEEQAVKFTLTPTGKYRELSLTTDTMINAGSYVIQIKGAGLSGLSIRGIRVQ